MGAFSRCVDIIYYICSILTHFGGIYGKHLPYRLIFPEVLGFYAASTNKQLVEGIILGSVLTSVLKHVACTGQPGVRAGVLEGSAIFKWSQCPK